MNNKKTGPIFSLVPRDRRSTQLVISTSTRSGRFLVRLAGSRVEHQGPPWTGIKPV